IPAAGGEGVWRPLRRQAVRRLAQRARRPRAQLPRVAALRRRADRRGAVTMTGAVISVSDLTVRYGPVLALSGVSLDLEPGRIIGVIGMNGSGKSTLFSAIMGTVRLAAGRVRLFGGDQAEARRANRVSYVPQAERVDWD